MDGQKVILWYGPSPVPGLLHKLNVRGFRVVENPGDATLDDGILGVTWIVVVNHGTASNDWHNLKDEKVKLFVDHGIFLIVVTKDLKAELDHLATIDKAFPWNDAIRFIPDWKSVHFDNVVTLKSPYKWHPCDIVEPPTGEHLNDEEKLLVIRAFPKAARVSLQEIIGGLSKSRVFMAYEKRREETSSIAHLTQPRLVKLGLRHKLKREAASMREVSPFVPFDLRPNLEIYIEGFKKSIYVADFVDTSESLFDVARAGRAEPAISNLFNRTLQRWRDRGRTCDRSTESLAFSAEELKIFNPSRIRKEYLDADVARKANLEIEAWWKELKAHKFSHRAATIHGDLHGNNVRVRGDDAILIDLGSVVGSDAHGKGAPLCFDVAMLEISLVFECSEQERNADVFVDEQWEREVGQFYSLDVIMNKPHSKVSTSPDSWLYGCLQRIRAFGIYEQSDPFEYAIALVIAMWRRCTFDSFSMSDKGRRVFALIAGARLLQEILAKRSI